MNLSSLSISIPAYNEKETLSQVVRESLDVAKNITAQFEILIIDDGSTDGTSALVDCLALEDSRIRVIHHSRNLGFGETLKEVYLLPQKEWIFFVPGDGQIAPRELFKLLPATAEFDMIIGRRKSRQDSWQRKLQAGIYNLLISLFLGQRVRDVDSVFLLRRKALEGIEIKGHSVFIHAEVCLKVKKNGFKITEVDIGHRPRQKGKASGSSPKVIAQTIFDFIRYCFHE